MDAALKERLFYVKDSNGQYQEPPKPIPHIFKRLGNEYHQVYTKTFLDIHCEPRVMTDEEFIASRPVHKKKLYINAATLANGTKCEAHRSIVSFFIKSEKTENMTKLDPIPRIIYPRHPVYNLALGKFLTPLEHRFYDVIDHVWKSKTVFKGMNSKEQGSHIQRKWEKFKKPRALMCDASRFDQHCSVDALKFEHGCYTALYSGQDKTELKRLLKMQLHTKGYGHTTDGYKFKVDHSGGRCSGDQNTALGNIIIMCSLLHKFNSTYNLNFELVNNGDDSVIIGEDQDIIRASNLIGDFFLTYGYTMKVEQTVTILEEIDFCQTKPVFVDDSYIMVRMPKAALPKDVTCLAMIHGSDSLKAWRKAVALGGMSLTGGIPIFQEFYKCMLQGTEKTNPNSRIGGLDESGFWYLCRGMTRRYGDISDKTRISFYLAFGIDPHEQIMVEEYYKNVTLSDEIPLAGQGLTHPQTFPPPYKHK